MWGDSPGPSQPFSFERFYSSLLQRHKLKPSDLGEMTLSEALLYTIDLDGKPAEVSVAIGLEKARLLATLPVEHYLAVARLRAG